VQGSEECRSKRGWRRSALMMGQKPLKPDTEGLANKDMHLDYIQAGSVAEQVPEPRDRKAQVLAASQVGRWSVVGTQGSNRRDRVLL
jgi:hypothetical protein